MGSFPAVYIVHHVRLSMTFSKPGVLWSRVRVTTGRVTYVDDGVGVQQRQRCVMA